MGKGDVKMYICFTIGETKYSFYEMVNLDVKSCKEEHVLTEISQYIRRNDIKVKYNCSIIDIIWTDGSNGNKDYKYLRDGNDFTIIEDEKIRELKFNQYSQEITNAKEF